MAPLYPTFFYVNNALFVGDWTLLKFKSLSQILKCFHVVSRLKVNFHKSMAYTIGVSNSDISIYDDIMGCEMDVFPFTYLGGARGRKHES